MAQRKQYGRLSNFNVIIQLAVLKGLRELTVETDTEWRKKDFLGQFCSTQTPATETASATAAYCHTIVVMAVAVDTL